MHECVNGRMFNTCESLAQGSIGRPVLERLNNLNESRYRLGNLNHPDQALTLRAEPSKKCSVPLPNDQDRLFLTVKVCGLIVETLLGPKLRQTLPRSRLQIPLSKAPRPAPHSEN